MKNSEMKFAVALLRGDEERILGLFDTKEEADAFGAGHPVAHSEGLQYCFSTAFCGGKPCGDEVRIYVFYNVTVSGRPDAFCA